MADYPNSGALFVREKRNKNAPDYGGDLSIEGDLLDYILMKAERGEEIKVEISGWSRMGRNNTRFISINGAIPYKERQQEDRGFQQSRSSGQGRQGSQDRYLEDQQSTGHRSAQQPQGRSYGEQKGFPTSRGNYPSQGQSAGQNERYASNQSRQTGNQYASQRGPLNDPIPFGNDPDDDAPPF